jgi:hypothetical protein
LSFRLRRGRGGRCGRWFLRFYPFGRRGLLTGRRIRLIVVLKIFVRLVVGNRNGAVTFSICAWRHIRIEFDSDFPFYCDGDILVDRARMSFLFLDTKFGQQLEDPVRLNL